MHGDEWVILFKSLVQRFDLLSLDKENHRLFGERKLDNETNLPESRRELFQPPSMTLFILKPNAFKNTYK